MAEATDLTTPSGNDPWTLCKGADVTRILLVMIVAITILSGCREKIKTDEKAAQQINQQEPVEPE
jgi:hypothetical protein